MGVRVQNWGFYFLDPPRGLGLHGMPHPTDWPKPIPRPLIWISSCRLEAKSWIPRQTDRTKFREESALDVPRVWGEGRILPYQAAGMSVLFVRERAEPSAQVPINHDGPQPLLLHSAEAGAGVDPNSLSQGISSDLDRISQRLCRLPGEPKHTP